jgi:hypothetical protein
MDLCVKVIYRVVPKYVNKKEEHRGRDFWD